METPKYTKMLLYMDWQKVFENAKVHGFSSFGERILIGSDGNIEEYRDYMSISGLGRSWGMHITFYRNQDGGFQ